MTTEAQLQKTIASLLTDQPDDRRLMDHLLGLSKDLNFAGLTWFWGPLLYQRNRALFRSFIFNNFSTNRFTTLRFDRVKWSQHADRLNQWLSDVRANRDTQMVRRLLQWKYRASDGWRTDMKAWNQSLAADYVAASGPAARAVVLDEYDDWFELDEDTATTLYEVDRRSVKFILRHGPRMLWGSEKRKLWVRLAQLSVQANDQELYEELYRRQTPIKEWSEYAVQLAGKERDPVALCEQLEKRHPLGFGLKINDTLLRLLELRGRDVIPYVRTKLNDLARGWISSGTPPFVEIAEKNGWWDLWAIAIRGCRDDKLFNKAVEKLVNDDSLADSQRISRLETLTGVSREFNWSGFGLARIHPLSDEIAVKLYARYPQLVSGPFRAHVMATWWHDYPELLNAAIAAEDHSLVDVIASRYVTRARSSDNWPPGAARASKIADQLCEYYDALRTQDVRAYALRAANVLTRVPAYTIYNANALLKNNNFARLLLVRSFPDYLAEPTAVRDLVEASEIRVQMLAYRILAQDDQRARTLAAQSLDILIGTILRPLHRKTRLAAFDALLNAARGDADAAQKVLSRARQALKMPDKFYPKEELIGLIGRILHHCPELRSSREQPMVYGLEEIAP